ncbi:HD domain-containing protein [Elusimicrobiota bacterium]
MINKNEIEDIFSEQLVRISDEALRGKVADVWVTACSDGGWESTDELKKIPFTLLTDTCGVDLIVHTIAVTEGALALARAQEDAYSSMPYPVNINRLVAGGLLHDVGKLIEIETDGAGGYRKSPRGEKERHPETGANLARDAGLSEEIINTIAYHSREGEGKDQVVETVLIHQADFACFNPLVMLKDGRLLI